MTKFSRRAALLQLPAICLALAATMHRATAGDYPTRPVRLIVGLAAGGPTDLVARIVAEWLSEHMSNQFVVENRTGAGGTVAIEVVINAPPDGSMLLFAGPTVTISPLLYKKLSNALDQLTPVGVVMQVPNIVIVTPSLPVATVQDFIDYAKTNPGKLSFASSGVGASPHLSGEYFKSLTGIDMVHVPYRGSGAAYPDLISGKVDVLFDNLGGPALQIVRSGQLRALAVTSAERWPLLPELPAVAETVPGYDVGVWYAMFAPKNTPPEIIRQLNAALGNVVADPKIAARFAEDGGLPSPLPVEDLAKFFRDDQAKWRKMVEAAGLSPE
jgi:tripartite-type tricarboxylate transporter receptor subunit TctC